MLTIRARSFRRHAQRAGEAEGTGKESTAVLGFCWEHKTFWGDKKHRGRHSFCKGRVSEFTRHHTQERTGKGDSLHRVWASSEGQGPVWWKERIREDHCLQGMEVCGEKAHFLSSLLKALDGLLYVLLTRTKPPREKNKASTWFALSKSEVSSVVWIQPLKSTLSGLKLLVRAPRGLIIWGHCPSSSIHLGSCSNYIEREEVESSPGVGIAFAFYND